VLNRVVWGCEEMKQASGAVHSRSSRHHCPFWLPTPLNSGGLLPVLYRYVVFSS
jgi:hypothetical protein